MEERKSFFSRWNFCGSGAKADEGKEKERKSIIGLEALGILLPRIVMHDKSQLKVFASAEAFSYDIDCARSISDRTPPGGEVKQSKLKFVI